METETRICKMCGHTFDEQDGIETNDGAWYCFDCAGELFVEDYLG